MSMFGMALNDPNNTFAQTNNTLNGAVQASQDAVDKAAAQKAQMAAFANTAGQRGQLTQAGMGDQGLNTQGSNTYQAAYRAAGGGAPAQRTAPSDSNLNLLKAVNPRAYTAQVQNYGGQAAGAPPVVTAMQRPASPSMAQQMQAPQQDPRATMLRAFGQAQRPQQLQGQAQQSMTNMATQGLQMAPGGVPAPPPQAQNAQGSTQGMNASGFANAFLSANPAQPKELGLA